MEFFKKILSFIFSKKEGGSSLVDVGDKKTVNNNKTLNDINVENNTGDVNIAGNDIKKD